MEHGTLVCSCGTAISKCGCMRPHSEAVRVVFSGCENCKADAEQFAVRAVLMGKPSPVDFTRATELTPEVEAAVSDAFVYHPWTDDQVEHGTKVRIALEIAVLTIIKHVPPGPDRTVAIRKIREARMDANSAITHQGRY